MKVKQTKNKIYTVMEQVTSGQIKSPPLLAAGLKLRKTKDNRRYFFVPLEENPRPEKLGGRPCQILEHHLSVDQFYNDKVFVLSAYHYTASIILDGQQLHLHGYFDDTGAFLGILVKDAQGDLLNPLQEWHSTFQRMSTQFTIKILAEVFHLMETLASHYDQELTAISQEIDIHSQALYNKNRTGTDISVICSQYLAAIKKYIDCQNQYNEVSFEPNHATIRFLQRTLDEFVIPQKKPRLAVIQKTAPLVNESEEKTADEPLINAGKAQKSKPKLRPAALEEEEIVAPEVPANIQALLDKHDILDKKTTAENIKEQFEILRICESQLSKVSDNLAITILILQNKLFKKANLALALFVKTGNAESVSVLLPFIRSVSEYMITQVAMEGKIAILPMLLKKYRGPKLLHINNGNKVRTDILYEETLPTCSLNILLKFGCDPNTVDLFGRSLLFIAITLDDPARVKMILEAKADVNQRSTKFTHQFKLDPKIEYLSDSVHPKLKKQVEKVLHQETRALQKTVKNVIDQVPLISSTPIMCAVQKRSLAIVRMLKERGCDFYECDDHGDNAFTVAIVRVPSNPATRLNEDLLRLLISECGLDINMKIVKGQSQLTGLFCAVQYRAFTPDIREDIEVLLNCHADPNLVCQCITADGKSIIQFSPFQFALQSRYYDLMICMLKKSKIKISEDDIKAANITIKLLSPDSLPAFEAARREHTQRFSPLPTVAGRPNTFFRLSEATSPDTTSESSNHPAPGGTNFDDH